MNGPAFFNFCAAMIGLCGVYAIFYYAIASPYISMDALLQKIGRIAVGVVVAMAVVFAFSNLFFGGGGAGGVSAIGVIHFAVGVIILVLALAVATWFINWMFPGLEAGVKSLVLFIVGGIALIVILTIAADALFGGLGWGLNTRPLWVR